MYDVVLSTNIFLKIKNQLFVARVPRRWVWVLDKIPVIQSAWIVNSGN